MNHDLDADLPVDPFIDSNLTELIYVQHFLRAMSEAAGEHLHAIRDRARLGNTSPVFAARVDELSTAVDEANKQGSSQVGQALVDALLCLSLHLDCELLRVVVIKVAPVDEEPRP